MVDSLPAPRSDQPAWALFLDVDGTLINLAERPDSVIVPESLPALLGRLKGALGGALALISGRSLASLDALLGKVELDGAGCHGAEIRIAGRVHVHSRADDVLSSVAKRLAGLTEGIPLSMVEMKSHSIAFHYRPPRLDAFEARRLALAAIAGEEGRLRLLDGKQVVEILPQAVGKGEAISHFLGQPPYRDRLPVFVGDDVTDEEGFREVNSRGGLSIRVGREGATEACFQAGSVADVVAWLAGPVCHALGCDKERSAS
ncbi:MAG: trehalose-phosphatase [Alphaproteobacteria bacterium]|nr:trehalose-phosphatase [Alphaproteobacteria bacterium]